MIPKAARVRLQNIKISKYLETRRLTEDVFGENVDANPGAVTRHMQENFCPCQKLKITVNSGFRTKIAVVAVIVLASMFFET